MKSASRRIVLPIGVLAILGLALGGCSSSSPGASQVGTADGIVKIEGPLIGTDAKLLEKSWAGWEKTSHIRIEYSGSSNFQEQIGGEAQQGNAPDLAIFEQPGLINDLATRGYIQKLPTTVKSTVNSTFPAQWVGYTTVGSIDYAAPLLAKLDGWVFYSPVAFERLKLTVPTTWTQLLALTEHLRASSGQPPWCEGFASDASSGATGENWINDLVLREDGPAVYDKWAGHKVPFSNPAIRKAFSDAGQILQNGGWVNAGFGGVASINETTTAQVASALESGKCLMTMQSSSFLDQLRTSSKGVETVGPQQNIWAFILPPINAGTTPFTVSGDFVAAFSSDSDTVKVQKYLASAAWATSRVKLGGAISPAKAITPSTSPNKLLDASVALLESSQTNIGSNQSTIRLSASDLMPSIVGEGTFLSGMVNWINGTPTSTVLATIDGSWPSK
jgi:alpha-glucoside transport system substrate-binding protein